jgi:hypothetical protein
MRKLSARKLEPAAYPTSNSVDEARERFMRSAVKLAPAVLAELEARAELKAEAITNAEEAALSGFVLEWASKWNLTDEWCRLWAIDQMEAKWRRAHGGGLIITSFKLTSSPFDPEIFTTPGWDVTKETPADFRARVLMALDSYVKKSVQRAATIGYSPIPEHQSSHFFWLAGFQILFWSRNAIAEAAGVERSAVIVAIRKLANFIGLNLRSNESTSKEIPFEHRVREIRELLKKFTLQP